MPSNTSLTPTNGSGIGSDPFDVNRIGVLLYAYLRAEDPHLDFSQSPAPSGSSFVASSYRIMHDESRIGSKDGFHLHSHDVAEVIGYDGMNAPSITIHDTRYEPSIEQFTSAYRDMFGIRVLAWKRIEFDPSRN